MSLIDDNGHKVCSRCGTLYNDPWESFSKDSSTRDKLRGRCKSCDSERGQSYRQRHVEEKREYDYWYHLDHIEEKHEYFQEHHREHREELREYSREYSRANPQVKQAAKQKRRATKLERNDGTVTSAVLKSMVAACNKTCMRPGCGATEHLTVDHIAALDGPEEGWHTSSNIQILCHSCNSSKGIKTVDYRPKDWPWRKD
jgi:5-methylcytosine-specific restriction endonuclease McrA